MNVIDWAQLQALKEIQTIEDTKFNTLGDLERYLEKNIPCLYQVKCFDVEQYGDYGRKITISIFDERFDWTEIQKYMQDRIPLGTQIIFQRRSSKNKIKFINRNLNDKNKN